MRFYREKGHDMAAWRHPDTNPSMARKLFRDILHGLKLKPVVD